MLKALGGDVDPQACNWPWYYFVLTGVAAAGFAAFSYYDLTTAEQTGRAIWLPRFIGLFYDLFGKWGVVGFEVAIALLCIGVGIWSAVTPNNVSKPPYSTQNPAS